MTKVSHNVQAKVGLFVLIGISLFVVTVLILGGNQFVFKDQITLKTQLKHAQGLGEGSLVSLAGIPIGYVTTLEMANDSESVIVNLDIDKSFQSQLTTEAIVFVKTQGALGDRFIYIKPSPKGKVLSDGDFLVSDNTPDFLDAVSEKTTDIQKIGDVISELSTLMKNINAENRSALLMENLTQTSKNLNGLSGNPELKKSLSRLNNILRKVDEGDGTLGRLINDPTLYDKILQLLGDSPRNRYLKPLIQNSVRHNTEASK